MLRGRNKATSNEKKKDLLSSFRTFQQNQNHKEGECMGILSAVYSHSQTTRLESGNLGRDLLREIGISKENPRFFDVISVGNLSICSLSLSSLWVER